jgi:hypothetical protein
MSAVLRTEATDETQGFMKVLRWERRPHSRLHDDWLRGWRGPGRGANGNVSKPAVLEAARRRSRSPDDSRRPRSTLFKCAAWARTIGQAKKGRETSSFGPYSSVHAGSSYFAQILGHTLIPGRAPSYSVGQSYKDFYVKT